MQETQVQSLGQEDTLDKEMVSCPVQYSCLGNQMDSGAWRIMVHGVTKQLDTTWQLKNNNLCSPACPTQKSGRHPKLLPSPNSSHSMISPAVSIFQTSQIYPHSTMQDCSPGSGTYLLTSSTAIISLRSPLSSRSNNVHALKVHNAHISNQEEFFKKEFAGNRYILTILTCA